MIAEKDSAAQQLEGVRAALAAAEESVQQLGGEVDELREALADREAKVGGVWSCKHQPELTKTNENERSKRGGRADGRGTVGGWVAVGGWV